MRDADAILTIIPEGSQPSPGTDVGLTAGEMLDKPMLTIHGIEDVPRILAGLRSFRMGSNFASAAREQANARRHIQLLKRFYPV